MPIQSLAHVCIKSRDLDATAAFYIGELGLRRLFNFTRHGQVIGFYMKTASDTFVEVFHTDYAERVGQPPIDHFCLQTDNIAVLRATLAWRGYNPGEVKLGADRTPQFWMKDPNGMLLEFQEYRPESAQLTGEDVEVDW